MSVRLNSIELQRSRRLQSHSSRRNESTTQKAGDILHFLIFNKAHTTTKYDVCILMHLIPPSNVGLVCVEQSSTRYRCWYNVYLTLKKVTFLFCPLAHNISVPFPPVDSIAHDICFWFVPPPPESGKMALHITHSLALLKKTIDLWPLFKPIRG